MRRHRTGSLPRSPGRRCSRRHMTTVLDLARFDIALDQDMLISAESREAMMEPTQSNSGEALPYGLGWYVQNYLGHKLIWHSGWWEDAYSALYLKIPEQELSFIVLANSEGVWWEIRSTGRKYSNPNSRKRLFQHSLITNNSAPPGLPISLPALP
ncbi:MAG: serine hydrolase [Porticoccaceae bacterium]